MGKLKNRHCLINLDDTFIFSDTFEQYMDRLEAVSNKLHMYILKLKASKFELFKPEETYLVYVVSLDGTKKGSETINAFKSSLLYTALICIKVSVYGCGVVWCFSRHPWFGYVKDGTLWITGFFLLRLTDLVNIFFSHVGTDPSLPGYYQYFSGSKYVFAQGHNTVELGIEPTTSRSGVPGSTTRPPRSPGLKIKGF